MDFKAYIEERTGLTLTLADDIKTTLFVPLVVGNVCSYLSDYLTYRTALQKLIIIYDSYVRFPISWLFHNLMFLTVSPLTIDLMISFGICYFIVNRGLHYGFGASPSANIVSSLRKIRRTASERKKFIADSAGLREILGQKIPSDFDETNERYKRNAARSIALGWAIIVIWVLAAATLYVSAPAVLLVFIVAGVLRWVPLYDADRARQRLEFSLKIAEFNKSTGRKALESDSYLDVFARQVRMVIKRPVKIEDVVYLFAFSRGRITQNLELADQLLLKAREWAIRAPLRALIFLVVCCFVVISIGTDFG